MNKKFIVRLSDEERGVCQEIKGKEKVSATVTISVNVETVNSYRNGG